MDSFLIYALLAGIGVALAAAPLGCFVVWRRMAFFGDATAHAALLGVAIGLALSVSVTLGALGAAALMALTITSLRQWGYAMDTALGVLGHSALALGLVAASFLTDVRVDLMAYLFGDILFVGPQDLMIIWGGGALIVGGLFWRWAPLLTATLNEDLARASGIDPDREERILTLALALVVAISMKVVGILLIAALLIIPAATARFLTRTPEAMAVVATGLAVLAASLGLMIAFAADTPAGPTIVTTAAGFFGISALGGRLVHLVMR